MSDDSKPKGPTLPGTSNPKGENDNKAVTPKTDNKVISIKESAKDSKKLKEKKRAHQRERKKRIAKPTVEKADSAEKATPQEAQEEQREKERKKQNDKQLKEKIRSRQQKLVKFVTDRLPPIITAAIENAANKIKGHPLVSSKSSGAADPRLSNNTVENPDSRPRLQLLNENRNELTHSKSNAPTHRPPGM